MKKWTLIAVALIVTALAPVTAQAAPADHVAESTVLVTASGDPLSQAWDGANDAWYAVCKPLLEDTFQNVWCNPTPLGPSPNFGGLLDALRDLANGAWYGVCKPLIEDRFQNVWCNPEPL